MRENLRMGGTARIIDAEFREMPGMRLTPAQAQRLWHLSPDECSRVLDTLVSAGRIARDERGRYCAPRS
jgi:hypothetical protein